MRLCALCGYITDSADGICAYHVRMYDHPSFRGDNWAAGNRIMCDFLHRGIVVTAAASPVGPDHDDSE